LGLFKDMLSWSPGQVLIRRPCLQSHKPYGTNPQPFTLAFPLAPFLLLILSVTQVREWEHHATTGSRKASTHSLTHQSSDCAAEFWQGSLAGKFCIHGAVFGELQFTSSIWSDDVEIGVAERVHEWVWQFVEDQAAVSTDENVVLDDSCCCAWELDSSRRRGESSSSSSSSCTLRLFSCTFLPFSCDCLNFRWWNCDCFGHVHFRWWNCWSLGMRSHGNRYVLAFYGGLAWADVHVLWQGSNLVIRVSNSMRANDFSLVS